MPDAILADFTLLADLGDGQDLGQHEEVCLHEQGEPAAGPRPWQSDVFDGSGGGDDPRHSGTQGGGVLEKIEVLPGALHGIVNGTKVGGIRVRIRIRETAAGFKIEDKLERIGRRIEICGNDFPRSCETEGLGEEMFRGHVAGILPLQPESCPQEPAAPTSFSPILAAEPCGQLS